jgi:hypothetical protein
MKQTRNRGVILKIEAGFHGRISRYVSHIFVQRSSTIHRMLLSTPTEIWKQLQASKQACFIKQTITFK